MGNTRTVIQPRQAVICVNNSIQVDQHVCKKHNLIANNCTLTLILVMLALPIFWNQNQQTKLFLFQSVSRNQMTSPVNFFIYVHLLLRQILLLKTQTEMCGNDVPYMSDFIKMKNMFWRDTYWLFNFYFLDHIKSTIVVLTFSKCSAIREYILHI